MSKIYSEERWDEDDACIECGELLVEESKVPGLCQQCYEDMTSLGLKSRNKVPGPSIVAHPPKK